MATYPTLSVGTNSDEVRKLQQALNSAGYNIAADGVYGNQTANAVKQYQQANGLTVDGIAGNQTLSKLYGGSSNTQQQSVQQPAQAAPTPPAKYDPGTDQVYQAAMQQLQTIRDNAPQYADRYSNQINELYQQITNRKPFSYDAASDPLYQQYRSQMAQLGNRAMQGTMGQAAALTGGYGSSYSQAVGQQQYDQYMQRAADKLPELSDRAFQQYKAAGDQMQQQYAMLGDLRDDEYGKFRDQQNLWLTQLQMAQNDAETAYDRGLSAWSNDYNVYQDQLSRQDSQRTYLMSLISSTGYTPSDAELAAAGISRAQADAMLAQYQAGLATGGSGGPRSPSGPPETKEIPTYESLMETALNSKINTPGASGNKATQEALQEAVDAGYITGAQAADIRKKASQLNRVR